MTVLDLVRTYLKTRRSIDDDTLSSEIQLIAQSLNIDLNFVDEAYAELIAERIDGNTQNLAVTENSTSGNIEVSKKKKRTPATVTQTGSAQELKPAILNLKNVIESRANTLIDVFDNTTSSVEGAVADRLANRYNNFDGNVIQILQDKLNQRNGDTATFRHQIGSIFDEAFADIINTTP
jgi:hypothetical protein